MTPAGIDPATFRIVAQHLNHSATAVTLRVLVQSNYSTTQEYSLYLNCLLRKDVRNILSQNIGNKQLVHTVQLPGQARKT